MSEETKIVRYWLIAAVVVISLITSCTANNQYQERAFKVEALNKGLNATAIDCAWNPGNKPECLVLVTKP